MIITNTNNPEYTPVNSIDAIPKSWTGDTIFILNENGTSQKKQYHLPVAPQAAPTEYKALNKIEVIELLRTVSGMNDAGELAFRKDANLELFWMKWNNDVGNLIHKGHALTDTVLSAVVASGHITEANKTAIFANWPTV